ncbi:zinc finger CCCH domain-containing protein 22 isoform X1 [Daucus carota subsp. sativus]|uniref:zinc finger CCCH domain-containing protein 22 isoform X1 n=1 Tax=Daucus carota subsp. sativus TaxID=79200 RepID=UPI0007EF3E70|nr:PREDICTED: zinc finger CCCH domain-containing protein 22 isoform X1 [Daucus carota subsp. sativus]
MDNNEATSTVLSRIKSLDPENGSKIVGYLLIKEIGEKEMIRLAFGPENHLISLINQVKAEMAAAANTPSASPFIPIANPNRPNPFAQSSPRIIVPNNGFMSPSSPSSPWFHSPKQGASASSLSYAAVVNGAAGNNSPSPFASPSNPSFVSPFFQNGDDEALFLEDGGKNMDFTDPIVSPGGRSDSMLFPFGNCSENHPQFLHRRSVSVNDVFLGQSDESSSNVLGGGFGWKPCMYFAKGFCKNGGGCKFVHGGFGGDSPDGSPKFDGFDELMRMKAIQHQRMAMAAGAPMPFNNRCMSLLNDSPRSAAAAALMMGDDYLPFGRCRHDRSDFAGFGFREHPNSSSRQIYLTFPADSTFKEEDVSTYFSTFGPVQDVRIPYQQKRMFGFVTFVYPETVKQILAKGNPHFVCDSRVLVKPYKEKGKLPDKKHMEIDDLPACFSPSGPSSVEPFDLHFGRRMIYNQEMMLRRKLEEQAELQQAIEFQGRRLMNLQLPEMMNPLHRHMAVMQVPFPAPGYPQMNPGLGHSIETEGINQEELIGVNTGNDEAVSPTMPDDPQDNESNDSNGNGCDSNKAKVPSVNESDPPASNLEHILPDSLFASPTKSQQSLVSSAAEMDDTIPSTSTLPSSNLFPSLTPGRTMASLSSRFSEMPRKPLV